MTHPYAELATAVRNGFEESRHFGSLVALDAHGAVAFERGPAHEAILPRSTVKPIQALACVQSGLDISGHLLAMAAASHTGTDAHVTAAREILAGAGLPDDALQCPPDWPEAPADRAELLRRGEGASRLRMNCSGKHAAMVATCVAAGWPTNTYLETDHPLQQRIATLLAARADEPIAHTAVDGCGAPLLGISLVGLARAIRSLVVAAPGSPDRAVADAMREHPFYVAGEGPTAVLMRSMPGVLAKVGAEGVLVAVASSGAAVALKCIDGSSRATTAIAVAALAELGEDTSGASDLAEVPLWGGGRRVGAIVPTDMAIRRPTTTGNPDTTGTPGTTTRNGAS